MLTPDKAGMENKAAKACVAKPTKLGATILRCPKCNEVIGERYRGKVFNAKACQCERGGKEAG